MADLNIIKLGVFQYEETYRLQKKMVKDRASGLLGDTLILVEHPAVLENAVVRVADSEGLVKPKAYIVLQKNRSGSDELIADLQEFVKKRIGVYKYPRCIEFVPQLPKTATGKIQRYKLRNDSL